MKRYWPAVMAATAMFALAGNAAAQDREQRDNRNRTQAGDQSRQGGDRFDDNGRQATRDWYNQHKDHPPAGLRNEDRLSGDQESRLHEGAVLDRDLRKKVRPAPRDLSQRLPQPPNGHRYVTIGGHVGLIDNGYKVHDVIHLHDER
jgi:Ni/Co efflux regulator RcnB